MRHQDTIAGLALLGLAGGYFLATRRIPDSSLSDAVGATGLPYVLAAALAALALMLVAKGLFVARSSGRGDAAARGTDGAAPSLAAGPAGREPDGDAEERSTPLRALGFVLIGVGYMAVAPLTGYAVGIALLVVAIALYERERLSARLVGVAAVGGLGFWLIFVKLLGTEQPISRLWS